jgi:glyoxylase-like metal-dependent hydrolase (beta-lactamase superfamily II)
MKVTREREKDMQAKKTIDWSCKHDILIQNFDGTYTPMDEPYYDAEEIRPGVFKIMSSGDYHYVIKGETFGVAIDSGYGAGNLREYLEELVGMPVPYIINTHDHFDHTANNGYFEKAYMHPLAVPLATTPFASFAGIDFITDYERVPVEDGFVLDMGNKTLEIFYIPEHTKNGIAILDRADRILFTGDEFMAFGKPLRNATVEQFAGYTAKLLAHSAEYDMICGGGGVLDPHIIENYDAAAREILADPSVGKVEQGGPQGHGPAPMPAGPNGELVYHRQMPHFGDGGAGKMVEDAAKQLCYESHGVRIMYNA